MESPQCLERNPGKGTVLKLESSIKRGQVLRQAAFEVVTSSNKSWHVPTKSSLLAPELTEERSVWQALQVKGLFVALAIETGNGVGRVWNWSLRLGNTVPVPTPTPFYSVL